jgi:hypothetical protein
MINLSVQNECLLINHLHNFYGDFDLPRVNLLWDTYYRLSLPLIRSEMYHFGGGIAWRFFLSIKHWLLAFFQMDSPFSLALSLVSKELGKRGHVFFLFLKIMILALIELSPLMIWRICFIFCYKLKHIQSSWTCNFWWQVNKFLINMI